MKPETAPLHATIAATADLHIYRLPAVGYQCLGCKLHAGRPRYIANPAALARHLAAHRNAGHDIPEGIEP